jgi:hypothetical protein
MTIDWCKNPQGLGESLKAPEKKPDDDYDEMTVAELDAVIDDWNLDISKSLNKAEKIAALREADAEE